MTVGWAVCVWVVCVDRSAVTSSVLIGQLWPLAACLDGWRRVCLPDALWRHHGSPEPCGPGLSGCNGRHYGSPEPCGPGLSGC